MDIPLNQIFYGPPGTGKTFNVTFEAEKIINTNRKITNTTEKFEIISKAIRQEYSTSSFYAKGNSIYRNANAIMWILGYFLHDSNADSTNILTKEAYIDAGLPGGSSSWSQRAQFLSQFNFTQDWRDSTTLQLNNDGIHLKDSVRTITPEQLMKWSGNLPQVVQEIYLQKFKSQLLNDFTPFIKTFFCVFNMLLNGDLYRQNNENRDCTESEKDLAHKYFDLPSGMTDIKWIGHIATILEGLGIAEENSTQTNNQYHYSLTTSGTNLLNEIIANWEKNYPDLFKLEISFASGLKLGLIHFITFHQSYSYEEFIEGIRPNLNNSDVLSYQLVDGIFKSICNKAKHDLDSNYVIVIDEINRGNISKIFGELITLIETTKRQFSSPFENPQSATLPYSKDIFSVPRNLYIIGTMNTADRSITSLDNALRRRFSFRGFPPKYDLLSSRIISQNGIDLNLADLLRVMNQRIEYLLDKDHLIGHSYFMKISSWENLCIVFRDNIIPLLQEYFYNDWHKIALVFGDTESFAKSDDEKFIVKNKITIQTLFKKDYEGEDNETYRINHFLVDGEFSKISEQFFIKGFF